MNSKRLLIIIGIVVAVVIGAFVMVQLIFGMFLVRPADRFAVARDSTRRSDVMTISTGLSSYVYDTDGELPKEFKLQSGKVYQLGTCYSGGDVICKSAQPECVDLSTDLVRYLASMPIDQKVGTAETTGYSIQMNAPGVITINACNVEASEEVIQASFDY